MNLCKIENGKNLKLQKFFLVLKEGKDDYKYIPNIIEERINGKISKIEITINAHNSMPDF